MKVGIPAWKTGENSFGVTAPYYEYICQIGGTPRLLSIGEFDPSIDLLMLPGGPDVDPRRYDQVQSVFTSRPCPFKEHFDEYILPRYIEENYPIFGICRGMQSLAVHFGGSLEQDMKYDHGYSIEHRGEIVHDIYPQDENLKPEFHKLLEEVMINGEKEQVNSIHHQRVVDTGEMEVILRSEDETIEVIHHPEKPIAAVQYHPEELFGGEMVSIGLINNIMSNSPITPVESKTEELDAT